jgi:predicted esterase
MKKASTGSGMKIRYEGFSGSGMKIRHGRSAPSAGTVPVPKLHTTGRTSPRLGFVLAVLLLASRVWAAGGGASGTPWLVLGPFIEPSTDRGFWNGFDLDYLASSGGEVRVFPAPGDTAAGKSWARYLGQGDGVDFNAFFGVTTDAVAYASAEFRSPDERTVALDFGSDDGAKIWLNGSPILVVRARRSLGRYDDALRVRLAKGTNRILVKVDQGVGEWGFSMRLRPLADEEAAFAASKPSALRLVLSDNIIGESRLRGVVMTVPALAVNGEAAVTVASPSGAGGFSVTVPVAEPFDIPLPAAFLGARTVIASGQGRLKGLSSSPRIVLLRSDPGSFQAWARFARSLAAGVDDPDRRATLEFLADQIEGRVDPSIATFDRNWAAISEIGAMTGLNEPPGPAALRKSPAGFAVGSIPPGLTLRAYRSRLDSSLQSYSVYVPPAVDPKKPRSLLVMLHGHGGDDWGTASTVADPRRPDFILLAPFGRGDLGYQSAGEADVLEAIEAVERQYAIDPDRIFLSGVSMGGYGAWRLGQLYADRFAGLLPFCGWCGTSYLENLKNLPTLIVHGTVDETVPISMDAAAADRLAELGSAFGFDRLSGVGHDALTAWISKTGPGRLYDYFSPMKRDPWPRSLSLRVSRPRYGRMYWLRVTELEKPFALASVEASVLDSRHLVVTTGNVASFELDLSHPLLAKKGSVLVRVDDRDIAVDAGKTAAFVRGADGAFARLGGKPKTAIAPHEGGGLADLFSRPLRIVYGTRRHGSEWRAMAALLADWSVRQGRSSGARSGRFRVLSDAEALADFSSSKPVGTELLHSSSKLVGTATVPGSSKLVGADTDILLLGSPEENSMTARYAAKLPLRFSGNAVGLRGGKTSGQGAFLVCPNPDFPSNLVGIISIPLKKGRAAAMGASLADSLAAYGSVGNETYGFVTPDLAILDQDLSIVWSGSFDRNWENLKPIE